MDDLNSYTCFNESDFAYSDATNFDPVNIKLLPGEDFIQFDLLNYGCRFALTNYRIIIISDITQTDKIEGFSLKSNIISIPLGLIYHIEYYGMVCVNILTKISCRFSLTFPDVELCERTLKQIKAARCSSNFFGTEFYRTLKQDFPSHFLINGTYCSNDWKDELNIIENEFQRLEFPSDVWRISDVNKDFKVCGSYPQYHIILKDFLDASVKDMAKFRSKGRFVSAVYRSIDTGAVLLRAGQPLTGMSGWRNNSDEKYFSLITNLNISGNSPSKIVVFDARSYTSAQLNKVKGGGMESDAYYPGLSIEFLNIPNMHTVRSSFESLSNAMCSDIKNFYEVVDKSTWLLLLRDLIKASSSICDVMHKQGKSVLVHCSDGWDRTPQLVSLALVLMDPFYRTIKGFKILIQREWIYFGHRFNERCALWPFETGKDFSPIFLQWLDCIHQLQNQFIDHFEFNQKFLIKLALHVYSGLFGTFNKSTTSPDETCSIWNFICNKEIRAYKNPLYNLTKTFNIMKPVTNVIEMKIWTGLYRDALDPNYRVINSSVSLKRDLPQELNSEFMQNSIVKDQMEDDYEGEDVEELTLSYYNAVNGDERSDSSEDMFLKKSPKKMEDSFFRIFSLKYSLDTIERVQATEDIQISQDIDIDGLVDHRDLLFNLCESSRQLRHLLKRRIQHYKKELYNALKINSEVEEGFLVENCADINSSDVLSDFEDDNQTIISELNLIDEVVLWVPDHLVTQCASCNDRFTMLNRKHHCRSCGKVFCNACSGKRSTVIKQKITWPERVCDKCYEDLRYDVVDIEKKSIISGFLHYLRRSHL